MSSYVAYQCSICRRTKDILQDNVHAIPDQCTITKGCLGRLYPVGTATAFTPTPPVEGLTDWYPRGSNPTQVASPQTAQPDFSIITSSQGTLTLAVDGSDLASLPFEIYLNVEQRKISAIPYSQFNYNISTATSVVSGKDSSGKNLRFDLNAAQSGQVLVRVNGVIRTDVDLTTPNSITFATQIPVGAVVTVLVYSFPTTTTQTLTFTRNGSLIPSLARGAWSNIDYVDREFADGTTKRYYLFSADTISGLTAGKIKVVSSSYPVDTMFLMAAYPFQSVDRYLNLIVSLADMQADYHGLFSQGDFIVEGSLLTEIYPALVLSAPAYLAADLFTTTAPAAVATSSAQQKITTTTILGPV